MEGEPVPIVEIATVENEDGSTSHKFALDEAALESILLDPKLADKKVTVVSVAGAFRKGKSFLLNFLLRYLASEETGGGDSEEWLGPDSATLDGFAWRGGSERETNGILLWSRPFLVKKGGEEIGVLLMDTQGAFDSQSTVKDCATVFALSTMLSSLQIYNLSQNMQEDDLQHLQLFTEYGRIALEESSAKPFQSLLFLIRDWSFPYEAEFGFMGGQRLLERRLQVSEKQHPELQQLRRHIRDCFEKTAAFLMPHPGLKVATSPEFRGQLADIEPEFKQQLRVLMPRLLAPDNLVLKRIDGQDITARDLLAYFKAYMTIFQGEELPEPKSMLLATAEANNLNAVSKAKDVYLNGMEEVCGGDHPYISPDELRLEHERLSEEAIRAFKDFKKMGGEEYSQAFMDKLSIQMEEAFENFQKVNASKNLFRSAKTPATLFVVLVIDYIFQEIFQFVGLDVFAVTCSTFLGVILITLATWAYTKYSGSLRDVGTAIDDGAEFVWTNALNPASQFLVSEGTKHLVNAQRQTSNDSSNSASAGLRHRGSGRRTEE